MSVLPQPLLQSLQGVTGFDETTFVQVHESGEQVTSVRFNPVKIPVEKIDDHVFPAPSPARSQAGSQTPTSIPELPNQQLVSPQPVPWCAAGRYLSQRPSFTMDPLFHAGAYYVQEASSMFLDHVIKTLYSHGAPPKRVLDLCAAPGGKSTLLSAALPDSFIVSNEVIKNRVTILAENISKWGSSNVAVSHNNAKDFISLPGYFDLLVVDAPCSGSGLFRKDPAAIDEWSLTSVTMCSLRQQSILQDVLPSLRQHGYLVYSTCSFSTAENEAVCDWIIDHLSLEPVAISIDASWGIVETTSYKHQAPGYRFYPGNLKGEGFFVACFKQPNSTETYESYPIKLSAPSKEALKLIEPYFADPSAVKFYMQKETIIAFPACWKEEFSTVQQKLSTRKSGVAIGTIKGKDFIPHHELALSGLLSKNVPFAELDEKQALQYLKRQDLQLDDPQKGWVLARYKNLNLGWMKLLPNRVNNYYPTDWRILKP